MARTSDFAWLTTCQGTAIKSVPLSTRLRCNRKDSYCLRECLDSTSCADLASPTMTRLPSKDFQYTSGVYPERLGGLSMAVRAGSSTSNTLFFESKQFIETH